MRRRNPESACDVDPESECGQEVASPDAALALGPRQRRGNGNGEGVDHRALVHAVELRVLDLVGVTHRRPGRGEARAVRPDPRMITGARETLGLDQAPRPGPRASCHPHSEGIEEERAGRDRGGLRKVFVVGSRDVLGEPPDGIPHPAPNTDYDVSHAEVPAGSFVVWEGRTWHAASLNTGNSPRVGITTYWTAPYIRQLLNFPYGLRPEVADALSEHERALMGFRTWETYGTSDEFGAQWARPGKDNTGELR